MPRQVKTSEQLEEVIGVLLVLAGGWYLLDRALKAAEQNERQQRSKSGQEWAKRVVDEIKEQKKQLQDA